MMGFWGGLCNGLAAYNPVGVIIGWLIPVGLITCLVLLVIWLVRRASGPVATDTTEKSTAGKSLFTNRSAKEVLQLRYARGEITREQYLQMRDDLA